MSFEFVGSIVPVELTLAVLFSTVPLITFGATVTWIRIARVAALRRPVAIVHVTFWPVAEQEVSEPLDWNVVPAGSVSVTLKPLLSEGPLLPTLIE